MLLFVWLNSNRRRSKKLQRKKVENKSINHNFKQNTIVKFSKTFSFSTSFFTCFTLLLTNNIIFSFLWNSMNIHFHIFIYFFVCFPFLNSMGSFICPNVNDGISFLIIKTRLCLLLNWPTNLQYFLCRGKLIGMFCRVYK